jgi:hypothetical protein
MSPYCGATRISRFGPVVGSTESLPVQREVAPANLRVFFNVRFPHFDALSR